ncbi:MAG: hypothetical protein IJ680_09045 [Paludibacteraceae bacterium]|nr:hypothetical protein [Paludibacteraceae bacterium]
MIVTTIYADNQAVRTSQRPTADLTQHESNNSGSYSQIRRPINRQIAAGKVGKPPETSQIHNAYSKSRHAGFTVLNADADATSI